MTTTDKQECPYCGEFMHPALLGEHEDQCHDRQKLCDGYGVCLNKGVVVLKQGKEKKFRLCLSCLKRFKEEHPEVTFSLT